MILVTGAAGFIGSCLVSHLNDEGHDDLILVDHDDEKSPNLKHKKYRQYIQAKDLFSSVDFSKVAFVFHLGACSSTTESNWEYLEENNLNYSKEIFKLCSKNKIGLVYASSAATYGDGEKGYDDDHDKVDSLEPLNLYGKSKNDFDIWALEQKETPPFWAGIKFFNVYGPNEYHKGHMRSIVHKAFEQIRDHGKVRLFKSYKEQFADGHQLRDFIYVKDVVRAMVLMMKNPLKDKSGIYNLGTGKARSFYDLVVSVFKSLRADEQIEYIEMPESIKDQYQYFTEANMDKFKSYFPDFNFHSLEEGVEDYVNNFLKKDDPFY